MIAVALRGTAATFIGIGLARFGFVPLFPAMVAAGWVDGEGAALLGAMALAGYLAGAVGGPWLGRRLGVPGALDAGAALVVLSFIAGAWNGGLAWLAVWRAVAGLGGGWLMALAGPAVQAVVPPARRGAASGMVIAGVASGIVVGALAMPWLLLGGPAAAWAAMGGVSLAVWLWARRAWPRAVLAPPAGGGGWSASLTGYVLSGAGVVAPMIYLSDLAVRGHGAALADGALLWAVFGVGALGGTLLGGRAVDDWGGAPAMRAWLAVQCAAMALLLAPWPWLLWPGALLAGFAGVGASAVTLAMVRASYGPASPALWARGTAAYAAGQAGMAFAMAAIFALSGERHAAVFGLGLVVSGAGLGVVWHSYGRHRR